MVKDQSIVAIATPNGAGAIGVIRISGADAFDILHKLFTPVNKNFTKEKIKGYELKFGLIRDGDEIVDEVLVAYFKGPKSFTGANVVEISCHGSSYILKRVLNLCLKHGARMAQQGEFTMQAYLNKKLDLSQAEAVADLISAGNKAAHELAMKQMKGSISMEIGGLREELIKLASLMELELDFSEEDVEFADRTQLRELASTIIAKCTELLSSFDLGNAIKEGIPVAIVGAPNAGKSTLLNALLKENRAIVSDIEGTTRDSIEEALNIGGIGFRIIDTAGIRETQDSIENLGIERTFEKISEAQIVLWLIDASNLPTPNTFAELQQKLRSRLNQKQSLIYLLNKVDSSNFSAPSYIPEHLQISAKNSSGLEKLEAAMTAHVDNMGYDSNATLISSARHQDALYRTKESLEQLLSAMDLDIPSDLLAQDLRQAIYYLGEITGQISSDEILGSIFSKFCIGK